MQSELSLPDNWTWVPLAELTGVNPVTYGVVQPGSDVASGVPMVRVNNFSSHRLELASVMRISTEIESKYRRTRLRPNDVLITIVGSVGQVAVVPLELQGWNIARAVALIRPEDAGISRWLSFCLRAPFSQRQLGLSANTTVQTTINLKDLRQLPIPMPPSAQREAITESLSALDDRIDCSNNENANLESIAAALFKSWFIDFDPVRAKADGRKPEGMSADIAALFPSEFVDSELGPIPVGWSVGRLDDLLVLQRGFDLPATQRTAGDFPVLAASGPSGTHHVSMAKGPGVTTGRSGVVGKVFYVHEDYWPLNTSLWVKEFKGATPAYAFHLLQTLGLSGFNSGSAVPTLNRNHVHGLPTLIPSVAAVRAFDEMASALLNKQRNNELQALSLAELRDILLPRLLSGVITVPT